MNRPNEVTLIAAMDSEHGIGIDNRLPWRLRKDLLRFKAITTGSPVIMGRKTWESLGRPLPGRRNIVVSRNPAYQANGAEIVSSVDNALALAGDVPAVFVIGGAQIYSATLAVADRLLITEVATRVAADAFFPCWAPQDFTEISREHHEADAENEFGFDFVEYRRVRTP